MKFSLRITTIGENKGAASMVTLFAEDDKKSTAEDLVNKLQLQKYVFTGSNNFFTQGVRLIMPYTSLDTLSKNLNNLNIEFSNPIKDMIQIDAISADQIEKLDVLANMKPKNVEPASNVQEMKYSM